MASPSVESVLDSSGQLTPETPGGSQTAFPRLKGKRKLLHGLKRIGSSQSVVSFGRSRASSYRAIGPASISCISLSSSSATPSSAGFGPSSFGSQFSHGYSTAPTTPGADTPFIEGYARPRLIGPDGIPLRPATSVPVPFGAKGISSHQIPEAEVEEDYFSRPVVQKQPRPDFDFWGEMPPEIRMQIFSMLKPREIVRASAVSKSWHKMCFDGQLWADLDASEYYRDIPAHSLVKIISGAGPFAKDLNLRGCVQLWDSWRSSGLMESCKNLQNISLEGCRIDRNSIHSLLYQNPRLIHINLSGLAGVTNSTLKIVAQQCPKLQYLNVSWCQNVDTQGLKKIIASCHDLRDLRASEVRGFDDKEFVLLLFNTNALERLMITSCDDLSDDSFTTLITGEDAPIDYLTGYAVLPPRNLKHLDISRCRSLTDTGLRCLAGQAPFLEGLQLSKCDSLTDTSLQFVLPTLPRLTHLDLEELDSLTNATLQTLAASPCAPHLKHLNISYCETLGDAGMLPILKACTSLRNLELDNTRISNLCLIEATDMVRNRCVPRSQSWDAACTTAASKTTSPPRPRVALRMAIYDCANVTWLGIREVMARNADGVKRATLAHHKLAHAPALSPQQPHPQAQPQLLLPPQLISLKVFYGYQPTVTEHARRCLAGRWAAATRLERKWAGYMLASEEAGAPGGFIGGVFAGFAGANNPGGGHNANGPWGLPGYANRRRRRRAREAALMHADEEGADTDAEAGAFDGLVPGIGRRRRARSGGALGSGGSCSVM